MEYRKKRRYIVDLVYYTFIVVAIYLVLSYGLGLISPFILAFALAFMLKAPARFVSKQLRMPYKPAAFFFMLLFYGTMGVLITLLGIKLFSSATDLILRLPLIYETQIEPYLISLFKTVEHKIYDLDPALQFALNEYFNQFIDSLGEFITSISMGALAVITGFASSLPIFFIKTLLMIISSFFIVMDYDRLTGFILRQFSERGRELIFEIKKYIVGTLFVYITSYALIVGITFVELSVGLTLLGLEKAITIALLIAIFDIMPVLGTGGIMIPWGVTMLILGDYGMGIGLLAVYLVVTVVRNIIEPKIVGGRIGLHPVVTLIGLFVGAQLFGIIGMFGLPVTLALLNHLNSTGAIKLFR